MESHSRNTENGFQTVKLLDVDAALQQIKRDVEALNVARPVLLGEAVLPNTHGVYMFLVCDAVKYIGEAKGSEGLRDRMRKHLSGDESHSIQKALKGKFPDRQLAATTSKNRFTFDGCTSRTLPEYPSSRAF